MAPRLSTMAEILGKKTVKNSESQSQPAGVIGGATFVGPTSLKACSKCGETKTISMFSWTKTTQSRAPQCKTCAMEASRKWRSDNPDKLKAQYEKKKADYAASPEKAKAQAKAWYVANKDRSRATNKAWYEENFDMLKERDRARRAANPEQFRVWGREWRQRNHTWAVAQRKGYKKANADRVKGWNRTYVLRNQAKVVAKQYEWVRANPLRVKAHQKKWRDENPGKCAEAHSRRRNRLRVPAWSSPAAVSKLYREARRLTVATGIRHEVDHSYAVMGKTVCGLHTHQNLRVLPAKANRSKGAKLPGHLAHELWDASAKGVFHG